MGVSDLSTSSSVCAGVLYVQQTRRSQMGGKLMLAGKGLGEDAEVLQCFVYACCLVHLAALAAAHDTLL